PTCAATAAAGAAFMKTTCATTTAWPRRPPAPNPSGGGCWAAEARAGHPRPARPAGPNTEAAMSDAGYTLTPIARIRSDFKEKFGIPRQSGLVEALRARVVFEPAFRRPEALRGLEAYSHL